MAITQLIQDGMVVDTSASSTSHSTTADKGGSSSLDKDAFLQLLVAQMKYQDPLEPTDNTAYISQLATFTQLEETQNMQAALQEMEGNALVGKQVILKVTSSVTGETSYVTGQVDYVMHENNKTYLSVNDKLYSIEDLDTVADSDYMDAVSIAKSFKTTVDALPVASQLTLNDEEKLTAVRKGYDALTAYQKQFIDEDSLKKFVALEEKMAELKKAAGDETEEGADSGTGETGGAEETTATK